MLSYLPSPKTHIEPLASQPGSCVTDDFDSSLIVRRRRRKNSERWKPNLACIVCKSVSSQKVHMTIVNKISFTADISNPLLIWFSNG